MPRPTSERPYATIPIYPQEMGYQERDRHGRRNQTGCSKTTRQRRRAHQGIERMVQDDAYCIDVIRQIKPCRPR